MTNRIAGRSALAAVLAVGAACLLAAQPALAQEGGRPLGQLTLKRALERETSATTEPPAIAQPEAPPEEQVVEPASDPGPAAEPVVEPASVAKAEPAPIFLRDEPREFAPAAASKLVMSVCGRKDGSDLVSAASAYGMGEPKAPPVEMMRALPSDARAWRAPSADGELFLVGYGVAPMRCAVAVLHAIPGATFEKTQALLMGPSLGFALESTQEMSGGVHWARMRAGDGQFIDVMEYPGQEGMSPVVRIDFLPK